MEKSSPSPSSVQRGYSVHPASSILFAHCIRSFIMAGLVSLQDVEKAIETIKQSPMVYRTPLLQNVQSMFGFADRFKLHLKMESMQNAGKLRPF